MKYVLCCALVLLPVAGWGANARNPYGNVNHANDAGNDTGDSRVESLNAGQLRYPGAVAVRPGYAPGSYAPRPYGYVVPPYYPAHVVPRPYYYGW